MRGWLEKFATRAATRGADKLGREAGKLRDEAADLRQQLAAAAATIELRDLQIAGLAEIIARDRERVKAETAIAARKTADCEGAPEDASSR